MSKDKWTDKAGGDFADAADWSKGVVPGAGDAAILGADGKAPYTVTSSADETVASLQTAANATLDITGGTFAVSNGTGKGVNAGTIEIAGGVFQTAGVLDNAGAIDLTGFSFFRLSADTRLKGGGVVDLGALGFLFGSAGGLTLTNVDNTIIGAGEVGAAQGMALINEAAGVIDATGSLTVQMGGGTVTNSGLLKATTASGVLDIFDAAVDGSGGGVISAGDGAQIVLAEADIIGGTLKSFGSGSIEIAAHDTSSVLDGRTSAVTLAGMLDIVDGDRLELEGAIVNQGAIALQASSDDTDLVLGADTALTGGGKINLSDSSHNQISGLGSDAFNLTNVDNTITGAGMFSSLHLVNGRAGIIDADSLNSQLVLHAAGTVANAGLIEATSGPGLILYGAVDGSAGGVILADGAPVTLAGADIIGGTLRGKNGGAVQTADYDTTSIIDGRAFAVTVAGSLRVNTGKLTVEGAITNTGEIVLTMDRGQSSILIGADTTLSGGGQVDIGDSSRAIDRITGATASTRLVNIDNTISGVGLVETLTLVNQAQGVIDANGAGLDIDTPNLTNAGLIEATGAGGLLLGAGALKNIGTIEVAGGRIEVPADVTGSGSALIDGGDLIFDQAFNQNVTFTGASGLLGLARSQAYAGMVTGFSASGGTTLDLGDIAFAGAGEARFNGTKTSGVLTVSDGTHTAHITLMGDFRHATFTAAADGSGGVKITASSGPAPPPHVFLAAMAATAPASAAAPLHDDAHARSWRPPLAVGHAHFA